MVKHLNIKILGEVQGVTFRYSAKLRADKLKIVGFAKNEPDGSVYIEVEGEEQDLETFVEWCKNGPDLAKIQEVKISQGKIQDYIKFSTR